MLWLWIKIKGILKVLFWFTLVIGICSLIILILVEDKKLRAKETAKEILSIVQSEAVKNGAGEWVADTNGMPMFRWKTRTE